MGAKLSGRDDGANGRRPWQLHGRLEMGHHDASGGEIDSAKDVLDVLK
jgi:hypothetical protein